MTRYTRGLALLAAVLVALLSLGGPASAAVRAEDAPRTAAGTALDLVLDASGSMAEATTGGSKIAAARTALTQVVAGLPDDATVGMRVFGATVHNGPGSCTDSQSVAPVAALDKAKLTAAIAAYKPFGETPIGYALQQAATDLPATGKRSIVLVSDGESNCAPDPCVVAKQLSGSGIDLQINVVGLKLSGAARTQLQCIAAAGHGNYYDADSAAAIVSSITSVALRALRPFSISGTPARGTKAAPGAPALAPGQYTDLIGSDQDQRFYVLPRKPGSTLHVSVVGRPVVPADVSVPLDALSLHLRTADGAECGEQYDSVWNRVAVLSAAVRQKSLEAAPACDKAESLVLTVTRGSDEFAGQAPRTGDCPFELLVVNEDAVSNFDALSPRVEDPKQLRAAAPEAPDGGAQTAGGASFTNAATLQDGHFYADTIRGGEALFYRVHVDEGQAPALTATLAPGVGGGGYANLAIAAFAPDRARITMPEDSSTSIGKSPAYTFTTPLVLRWALPPVRYRNRENPEKSVNGASVAGWYYFEVAADKGGKEWQAPMRLSVKLSGQAETAPAYASPLVTDPLAQANDAVNVSDPSSAPTPEATTSAAAASDATPAEPDTAQRVVAAGDRSAAAGSGPSTLVLAVGGLLAFLAGGLAAGVTRRVTA